MERGEEARYVTPDLIYFWEGARVNRSARITTSSINTNTYHYSGQKIGHLPIENHPYSMLRVPTTQLAKMSIDLKFVELTADVLEN